MPTPDELRLTLPSAFLLPNGTQISSKEYPLELYAKPHFRRVTLERISYTPAFAKVQIYVMRGGVEMGQYAGVDGQVILRLELTPAEQTRVRLYNLSIESEVAFTFHLVGWSIGEVP